MQRLRAEDPTYGVREVACRSSLPWLRCLFARFTRRYAKTCPVRPSSVFLSASKRRCPTSCSFHGTLHSRPTRQVNRCHCSLIHARTPWQRSCTRTLHTWGGNVRKHEILGRASTRFPAITRLRCHTCPSACTTWKFQPPYERACRRILVSLPPFLSFHTDCIHVCVHEET